MSIQIKRFGENSDSSEHWYEDTDGKRTVTNEKVTDLLWTTWINIIGSTSSEDENGMTYTFENPQEFSFIK